MIPGSADGKKDLAQQTGAKRQRQQRCGAGDPTVAQAKDLGETGMLYMYACVRACLRQVSQQEGGLSDDGER